MAIADEIGGDRAKGVLLGRLGVANRDLGRVEKAISFHEGALSIAQEVGDRQGEELELGRLGIAYYALGRIQQAIEFFRAALTIAEEISDLRHKSAWLHRLGVVRYTLEEVEQAIELHKKALRIARKINDQRGESLSLLWLGRALLTTGQLAEAEQRCAESLALDAPRTTYQAALTLGVVHLHQRDKTAGETFADAVARCRGVLDKTASLYEPRYALGTALVGQAVCDPRWVDEDERAELLAPALEEYQRALETCDASGVIHDAVRDLELIRSAGSEGLETVFELLKPA